MLVQFKITAAALAALLPFAVVVRGLAVPREVEAARGEIVAASNVAAGEKGRGAVVKEGAEGVKTLKEKPYSGLQLRATSLTD